MQSRFRVAPFRIFLGLGVILIAAGLTTLLIINANISSGGSYGPAISYIKSNSGTQKTNAPKRIEGVPVKISIPSLAINLNVLPGYYDAQTKSWTLSLDSALYAKLSAPANNQRGLTFIYGHYRPGVFMNLHNIMPGTLATLTASNGHEFSYKYNSNFVTDPSDTSMFGYTGSPILVVQTCTGAFFQNRQLFVFDFAGVVV